MILCFQAKTVVAASPSKATAVSAILRQRPSLSSSITGGSIPLQLPRGTTATIPTRLPTYIGPAGVLTLQGRWVGKDRTRTDSVQSKTCGFIGCVRSFTKFMFFEKVPIYLGFKKYMRVKEPCGNFGLQVSWNITILFRPFTSGLFLFFLHHQRRRRQRRRRVLRQHLARRQRTQGSAAVLRRYGVGVGVGGVGVGGLK